MNVVLLGLVGAVGGIVGSVVGLGGGVVVVPVLHLFFDVPIHEAIAASLVGIVATSTTAAVGYVRRDLSNMRLGMTLETATTIGGVTGGLTATALNREVLSGLFAGLLVAVSAYMLLRRRNAAMPSPAGPDTGLLDGRYHDHYLGEEVAYRVKRVRWGLLASAVAGHVSGLLGIGGGVIKVPFMTLAMGVPIKAATATSNFMIGVTACASAFIYYAHDLVDPLVAAPVALGVTTGAYVGGRLAPRMSSVHVVALLTVVLLGFAIQMALAAVGVRLR